MLIRASALAVLCFMTLSACGASGPSARQREALISKGLVKLQREHEAARRNQPKGLEHGDVLSILALYAPPPRGVSAREWNAAIRKDGPLQREFNTPGR